MKTSKKSSDKRSGEFYRYFLQYLNELNVKIVEGYKSPYKLSVFPQQGVELLKTMLAYHFAFNMVINETDEIINCHFVWMQSSKKM